MRMDPTRGQPASALVNRMSERELAEALLELGDENDAPADRAADRRAPQADADHDDRGPDGHRLRGPRLHAPARRRRQAPPRRAARSRPCASSSTASWPTSTACSRSCPTCLKPGGVAAIISFHSGEDRRVKAAFRDGHRAGIYSDVSPDPITADEAEQRKNPRSRSAKLRWRGGTPETVHTAHPSPSRGRSQRSPGSSAPNHPGSARLRPAAWVIGNGAAARGCDADDGQAPPAALSARLTSSVPRERAGVRGLPPTIQRTARTARRRLPLRGIERRTA